MNDSCLLIILALFTSFSGGLQGIQALKAEEARPGCTVLNWRDHQTIQLGSQGDSCQKAFFLAPKLLTEGSPWDHPEALILGRNEALLVDFARVRSIGSLLLQRDHNDTYAIYFPWPEVAENLRLLSRASVSPTSEAMSFSPDVMGWPDQWTLLATVAPEELQGLRTYFFNPGITIESRYILIKAQEGDGFYSVSRLVPGPVRSPDWQPPLKTGPVWSPGLHKMVETEALIYGFFILVLSLFTFLLTSYLRYYFTGNGGGLRSLFALLLAGHLLYWWPLWKYFLGH